MSPPGLQNWYHQCSPLLLQKSSNEENYGTGSSAQIWAAPLHRYSGFLHCTGMSAPNRVSVQHFKTRARNCSSGTKTNLQPLTTENTGTTCHSIWLGSSGAFHTERNDRNHIFRDQVIDNSSADLSCTLTHLRASIEQIKYTENRKVPRLKKFTGSRL